MDDAAAQHHSGKRIESLDSTPIKMNMAWQRRFEPLVFKDQTPTEPVRVAANNANTTGIFTSEATGHAVAEEEVLL